MKVFITFMKDGYNGMMVDKVFLHEEDAEMYATDDSTIYTIEGHEVIESLEDIFQPPK